MKTYTYSETEYFVLQHLYYAMGKNRMKWYEYRHLMMPTLRKEIKNVIGQFVDLGQSTYNSYDIDTVIRKIKEMYEMFGQYEGYSVINEYIKQDMATIAGGK